MKQDANVELSGVDTSKQHDGLDDMEFLGMNLDHPHLAPQAAALLSMTDELRIKAMRTERWIGFARARYTLGHLQSLCDYAHRSERRAIRHGYY